MDRIEKAPIVYTPNIFMPLDTAQERQRDADHDYYTKGKGYEDIKNQLISEGWKDGKSTYCAYCGKEYPLDTDAKLIGEHIATCEKHPIHALKEQYKGWKSPEEVYQFVVDATNRGNAIGANQARTEAFKEVGKWLDKAYDFDGRLASRYVIYPHEIQKLKSGELPGEG